VGGEMTIRRGFEVKKGEKILSVKTLLPQEALLLEAAQSSSKYGWQSS
jgi:uncharacterized protein YkuJ